MVSMEKKDKNVWFLVSICLIIVTVISASLTMYYYTAYTDQQKQLRGITLKLNEVSYSVNILIKYQNGTKLWYNNTLIPIGWSLFNTTLKITNGKVEGSSFITSINSIGSNYPYAWIWYLWDSSSSTWKVGDKGADAYILRDKDVAAWYLVDISNYPNLSQP
ncbi:MAG: hypothetical protein QG670_29 [Thermoproteota archaeon]|nr:hypothetical protein [Thermoproteota archaeon]